MVFSFLLPYQNFLDDLFYKQELLFILSLLLCAAITVPFIILLLFRFYRWIKKKYEITENSKATDQSNLTLKGCFNSNIIDTLYHNNSSEEENVKEEKSLRKNESDSSDEANESDKFSDDAKMKIESETTIVKQKCILIKNKEKRNQIFLKKLDLQDENATEALKKLTDVGLHGKLATAQLHAKTTKIEQSMTDEERKKESDVRREQLNVIFQMMQGQSEKFGLCDKNDLVEQMKLYAV